jgi:ribosomal protein L37AE/L43A
VPCGWCGKKVLRRAAHVKSFKAAYCKPVCYHLAMAKVRHEAKEAAKAAESDGGEQVFVCGSPTCRGEITDHKRVARGLYECLKCKAMAAEPKASMSMPPRSRAVAN